MQLDKVLKFASSTLAVLMLSSCAKLYTDKPTSHTDVKADQTSIVADAVNQQSVPETFVEALKSSPVASASTLQALMSSPKLDELLAMIRANNLRLQIEQKQLAFDIDDNKRAQFDILPSVDAKLAGDVTSRQQMDPVRQISLALSARWEVDVWGIVRDQVRGSDVDLTLREIAVEDAEQSLMLNGIRAWLNVILQKELLRFAKEELTLQKSLVRSIRERVQAGLLDASEYESSKRQITNLQTRVDSQVRKIDTAKRDLIKLSSQFSLENIDTYIPEHLPSLATLNTDSTPLDVLTRRTDMKKAYWELVKSDLSARIAYKNQFPRFTLTASKSSGGKSLASLLDFGKISSQLASNLTRALIGSDDAVVQAEKRKLSADVQYLRYQQTILDAFHEVEQALSDYKDAEISIKSAKLDVENAKIDEKRVHGKFLAGLSDYLQQKSALRAVFSSERALVQAEYQQLIRRVELAKVLGYAY